MSTATASHISKRAGHAGKLACRLFVFQSQHRINTFLDLAHPLQFCNILGNPNTVGKSGVDWKRAPVPRWCHRWRHWPRFLLPHSPAATARLLTAAPVPHRILHHRRLRAVRGLCLPWQGQAPVPSAQRLVQAAQLHCKTHCVRRRPRHHYGKLGVGQGVQAAA